MDGTRAGWGAACTAVLVVALGTGAPAVAHEDPAHEEHGPVATETDHAEHEPDHVEHETDRAQSDHAEHEPAATSDHDEHETDPAETDHAEHETEGTTQHTGDHEAEPDAVSGDTRVRVLSGFGAANAAVLGGALVLRRRDRRTGKGTDNRRGNR